MERAVRQEAGRLIGHALQAQPDQRREDQLAGTAAWRRCRGWPGTTPPHSLLERTLDDSANRRVLLPEAFLISDELLRTAGRLVNGLVFNGRSMRRNLAVYGPFAAIERVLMALVKAGADRQEMHERLRQHALPAWRAVQAGGLTLVEDHRR